MVTEGSLCRAREAYYWPLMNVEIKEHIAQCFVCNYATLSDLNSAKKNCNLMKYLTYPGPKWTPTCLYLMERTMWKLFTTTPTPLRWTS